MTIFHPQVLRITCLSLQASLLATQRVKERDTNRDVRLAGMNSTDRTNISWKPTGWLTCTCTNVGTLEEAVNSCTRFFRAAESPHPAARRNKVKKRCLSVTGAAQLLSYFRILMSYVLSLDRIHRNFLDLPSHHTLRLQVLPPTSRGYQMWQQISRRLIRPSA